MTTDPPISEDHSFTREQMAFLLNLTGTKTPHQQIPHRKCIYETVFVEEDSYCDLYKVRVDLEDCANCKNSVNVESPELEPEPEPQLPDEEVNKEIMVDHPDFLEID